MSISYEVSQWILAGRENRAWDMACGAIHSPQESTAPKEKIMKKVICKIFGHNPWKFTGEVVEDVWAIGFVKALTNQCQRCGIVMTQTVSTVEVHSTNTTP